MLFYYSTAINGMIIDKFIDVPCVISRGAYANVYETVHDNATTDKIAVKIYKDESRGCISHDKIKEIAMLKRMNNSSEYIVGIIDLVWSDIGFGFTMEFYPKTLANYISAKSHNKQEKNTIAKQIINAVIFLHSIGIMHRDIKPANILLDAQNNAKLADFGLACWFTDNNKLRIIQTIYYRAPEVIMYGKYDESTDMWSLACVLYELFNGTVLFKHREEGALLNSIIAQIDIPDDFKVSGDSKYAKFAHGCIESAVKIKPEIYLRDSDDKIADVFRGCLHINPVTRFKSADCIRAIGGGSKTPNNISESYKPLVFATANPQQYRRRYERINDIIRFLYELETSPRVVLQTVIFCDRVVLSEHKKNRNLSTSRTLLMIIACIIIKQMNEERSFVYSSYNKYFHSRFSKKDISIMILHILDNYSADIPEFCISAVAPVEWKRDKMFAYVYLISIDPRISGYSLEEIREIYDELARGPIDVVGITAKTGKVHIDNFISNLLYDDGDFAQYINIRYQFDE